MRRVLLGAAIWLVVATAATATDFVPEAFATVKVGVTTSADVVSQFGAPTTTVTSSDGSKEFVYTSTRSGVDAVNSAIASLFDSRPATATSVTLVFDRAGILRKTSTTTSQVRCDGLTGCQN